MTSKKSTSKDSDLREGSLTDFTVPDLCARFIRHGTTGALRVEHGDRRDEIFFQDGKLVAATTTDRDFGVAEEVLKCGEITIQEYHYLQQKIRESESVEEMFSGLGLMKGEELEIARERQLISILRAVSGWRQGTFRIRQLGQLPAEVHPLALSTERLLLDAVERVEYWSLIFRGIQSMSRTVGIADDADVRVYNMDLTEEESHVYSLAAGNCQSIQALCNISYLSQFRTCRTLWALLSVGLMIDMDAATVKAATLET